MPTKNFPPIYQVKFPTMPLSYPHDERGWYFVSQYYWFIFQESPKPALSLNSQEISPITYRFSLSAFGRRDVIPESSVLPIAIATIEQTNLSHPEVSALYAKLGLDSNHPQPSMKGLFINNTHFNLGEVECDISIHKALDLLLKEIKVKEIKEKLSIEKIDYVGDFREAQKHTFLPYSNKEKQISSPTRKTAPLSLSILIIFIVLLFIWFAK